MSATAMSRPRASAHPRNSDAASVGMPAAKKADVQDVLPTATECSAIGRHVRELVSGNPKAAADLLACLLTTNRRDVQTLRAAYAGKHWGDLRAVAHRIKGTAQLSGAATLVELCQQVETWADQRDAAALLSAEAMVSASVQRLSQALSALAGSPLELDDAGSGLVAR